MNPFLSVRFRLFALCFGLLVVMGGANLLLGQINSQHETQVLLQQEQYRRVSVAYSVQQALGTWRYWTGQVNAAGLVENASSEKQAQARPEVEKRLAELAQFDEPAVAVIREALEELPVRLREGTLALVRRDSSAETHFNESAQLLSTMERALNAVAQREQGVAEDVQR